MAPQQERAAFLPGPISFCILPPGSAQGISPKQTNKFLTPHILETLWPGTDFQLHSSISGACCSLGLCSSHLKIHRMFSSLQRNSLERTKVFIFARMEFLPLTAACSLCSVPDAPCTYPFLNSAPIPPLSHILALHAPQFLWAHFLNRQEMSQDQWTKGGQMGPFSGPSLSPPIPSQSSSIVS